MNCRNLISVEGLSWDDVTSIFTTASRIKSILVSSSKKLLFLQGKTVVNFFVEPSTRTRVSFERAAKQLSAEVIDIDGVSSSLTKGESLKDMVRNLEALKVDGIVMRHPCAGAALYVSEALGIPVINAGDGAHGHPTQALLDGFTLLEHFKTKDLHGKKVAILGDVLFSRVARSNIDILKKLGAEVTLVGPATLVPKEFSSMGVEVVHNIKDGISDADVVMVLRIQMERQAANFFPSLGEYSALFGLNEKNGKYLKDGAVILHPGPVNRDVEISNALADSSRSLILRQVSNGLAVRMAVLCLCINPADFFKI